MCINKITPLQNEFRHYISTCTVQLITTRFQDDPKNNHELCMLHQLVAKNNLGIICARTKYKLKNV